MTIYDSIGGEETCRRLAEAFYARVPGDPILRRVYGDSYHCAVKSLAMFLTQQLGGPCVYSGQRYYLSLHEAHLRFGIGQTERDAWVKNMALALDEVGIGEPARGDLSRFFAEVSQHLINRGERKAGPAPLVLDEAVAAVRSGDRQRLVELAGHAEFRRDRAAWVALLAMMADSEDAGIVEDALARVLAEPALAHEPCIYDGTLLHAAAGAGCLPMVDLLLRLGADPNARDKYGHPPLYFVGNACTRDTGAAVVRALVQGGADVNAQDRVKRCTALHMAARRGNVEVARALLECGADRRIEDRSGVTPLQRAINCRKREVAAVLRGRD